MITPGHELHLTEASAGPLSDHQKGFEGFVHDVENAYYYHIPIDGQQTNCHEYVLRNIEIRLLTIHNCIQTGRLDAEALGVLVQTEYIWASMKNRVDSYLSEVHQIISQTFAAPRPVRESLVV